MAKKNIHFLPTPSTSFLTTTRLRLLMFAQPARARLPARLLDLPKMEREVC